MVENGVRPVDSIDDRQSTVKWFDARKGFGFLTGPDGIDVFIHFSVIEQSDGFRTLKDGEEVIYSAAKGPKGWAATKVRSLRPRGQATP
jgi:CspA family cold shock protein